VADERDEDKIAERAELALTELAAALDVAGGTGGVASVIAGLAKFGGAGRVLARIERAFDASTARLLLIVGSATQAAEDAAAAPEDLRAILDGLKRAARNAVGKKWKLLEHAARNAFDRDLYESGMVLDLLEKLERLSYPEIHVLQELPTEVASDVRQDNPITERVYLLNKLLAEGLIVLFNRTPATKVAPGDQVRPSEVGVRLVKLLRVPPSTGG
jgi:hypothetical protein